MLRRFQLLALSGLLSGLVACSPSRYSSRSFALPSDGDPERGKLAFVELGCNACHDVAGVTLPAPAVRPVFNVPLGGEVPKRFSDAYLVTSIISPSHHIAPYPKEQVMENGKSRMPTYADRITVRQLTDLVAFLQANYRLRVPPPEYYR
jgi:sulfur-oxidizing protein SoxX